MEEILHHHIKPCKWWDKLPTSTGEFSGFLVAITGMTENPRVPNDTHESRYRRLMPTRRAGIFRPIESFHDFIQGPGFDGRKIPIYLISGWWFHVGSNIFYFHPYLGKWSNLTSIFFKWGFNHQLGYLAIIVSPRFISQQHVIMLSLMESWQNWLRTWWCWTIKRRNDLTINYYLLRLFVVEYEIAHMYILYIYIYILYILVAFCWTKRWYLVVKYHTMEHQEMHSTFVSLPCFVQAV